MGFVIKSVWASVLSVLTAASVSAAPAINFTATGATASGIHPGGAAIWFVHSVTAFSGSPRLSRVVRVTNDDDGDGRVSLEASVTRSSVWALVDFSSGDYVVASPEGGPPPRELQERGNGWAPGRAHLDFDLSELDVLLVRPGRGAWVMRAWQGGPLDGDRRADGNLRVSLADMTRLHGSEPTPPVALPRDLLIAVEPTELFIFVRSAQEGRP